MNQHLIDWNLERAADELTWANRVQARLYTYPQQYASEIAECRYEVGMHIASANALIAAANLAVVLALLDDLEAAHAARREAQTRVAELTEQVQALGRGQKWSVINGIGDALSDKELDAAVYKAREAA